MVAVVILIKITQLNLLAMTSTKGYAAVYLPALDQPQSYSKFIPINQSLDIFRRRYQKISGVFRFFFYFFFHRFHLCIVLEG